MSSPPVPDENGAIASAIHLEFIRSIADGSPESGGEQVEAFHRALFLARNGRQMERAQQDRRVREERLATLELRLKALCGRLAGEDALLPALEGGRPDTQPKAPWNAWDLVMFIGSAFAVCALLAFGVFNVSFNLLESGIVTFAENPVRAYFWAALLPVGALAVKVGWDLLETPSRRARYLWTCLVAGVAALLVWIATYASVYPRLSRSAADEIEALSVFSASAADEAEARAAGARRMDMALVASQALAEICLSAVLGMYMTQLYGRHRPVRLAPNPAYVQLEKERRLLDASVAAERHALAEARGEETRLENQLAVFVAYARSLFVREAALRRDQAHQKRLMLDELAEHIRARIGAEEPRGAQDNGELPPIAFNAPGQRA